MTFGDILRTIPCIHTNPWGLTFDGKYIWQLDYGILDQIYQTDRFTGNVVYSIPTPGNNDRDIAFDGKYIWVSSLSDVMIYQVDIFTGAVIRSIIPPGLNPHGLTFDGKYLWHGDIITDRIYQIDPQTGAVITNFIYANPYGLAWDGKNLIVSNNINISIVDVFGSVIISWVPPATSRGVTFDGKYFWFCETVNDLIYQVAIG